MIGISFVARHSQHGLRLVVAAAMLLAVVILALLVLVVLVGVVTAVVKLIKTSLDIQRSLAEVQSVQDATTARLDKHTSRLKRVEDHLVATGAFIVALDTTVRLTRNQTATVASSIRSDVSDMKSRYGSHAASFGSPDSGITLSTTAPVEGFSSPGLGTGIGSGNIQGFGGA